MLIFGFRIPPGSRADRGPVVVVLVIERENLERMQEADPFDLQFAKYRGHLPIDYPLKQVDLIIAYEEDMNAVMRFHKEDNLPGLMKYLERGRHIQPGDALPHPNRSERIDAEDLE